MTDLLDPMIRPDGQGGSESQSTNAVGSPSASDDQLPREIHTRAVAAGTPSTTGQELTDTHGSAAGGGPHSPPATEATPPTPATPGATPSESPVHSGSEPRSSGDGWLELRIWAEMFHDAQQQRIASVNRAERGGVDPDVYAAYTESLATAEHVCRLNLRRCYKRVVPAPIREWQKATLGVGDDLLARLLGHLGHPRIATPHHWEGTGAKRVLVADEPYERTVGQLWQYAGHGRPGRAQKGATFDDLAALGSPTVKMLVHLNAEAIVKAAVRKYPDAPTEFTPESRFAKSALGQVYIDARTASMDKLHTAPCVRCGPSGKPAQPGTPWGGGHKQGDALRRVGKEMLRDLWRASA